MTATSVDHVTGDVDRPTARDLSSTFGVAAAASLRGTRRRSRRQGIELPTARPDDPEPQPEEDDVQNPTTRRAPSAARPARAAAPRRGPDASAPSRRPRRVRVRDRWHIDMILLAVASEDPAGAREFIDLVREHSGGAFVLPESTVHHELHRLKKDRLIAITRRGGARRYSLTELGRRILSGRVREWEAFYRGFGKVLDAIDVERS